MMEFRIQNGLKILYLFCTKLYSHLKILYPYPNPTKWIPILGGAGEMQPPHDGISNWNWSQNFVLILYQFVPAFKNFVLTPFIP